MADNARTGAICFWPQGSTEMTVKDLNDKRLKAIADARAILDAAGDKGLSAEDAAKYDAFMAEGDNLKAQAERAKRLEDAEAEAREAETREAETRSRAPKSVTGTPAQTEVRELPFPQTREHMQARAAKTPEYKYAFDVALRFGKNRLGAEEARALSVGVDSAGGYLVPDEFNRQLIQDLDAPTIVRQRATVIGGVSGDKILPFVSAHGSASWTGEEKAFSESDETFGTKTLSAHKLTRIVKISQELMDDSAFDVQGYLASEFARAFNAAEDTAFVGGTGAGQPRGFVKDGTAGVTAASSTAVTADELIDLYHTLPIAHRPNGAWFMADATLKAVRKLKSGDGQYLWVPGLQAGQSDTLLGKPVAVSDDMPAMTSGLRAIYFGNLRYYYIVDRGGFYLKLLSELYAASGQVGFIGYKRTDGRLILDTPMRYLTMA